MDRFHNFFVRKNKKINTVISTNPFFVEMIEDEIIKLPEESSIELIESDDWRKLSKSEYRFQMRTGNRSRHSIR